MKIIDGITYIKAYIEEPKGCNGCAAKGNSSLCVRLPDSCSGDDNYIGEFIWKELEKHV